MAIEKQILVSEKDFQELEDKAKQWDEYERDHRHYFDIEVFLRKNGQHYNSTYQIFAYNESPNTPEEFRRVIEEAKKAIYNTILPQQKRQNLLNVEVVGLKEQLNKIPKWIRKVFGAE